MKLNKSNNEEIEDLSEEVRKLTEENKRLRRAVDELAILNELALGISGSIDSEEIMRTIISRSIRSIGAEQGDITLIADNKDDPGKTLVRSMISSVGRSPLHLNQNLMGWMQINKKPLLINDPANDSRFQNVQWQESIYSLLSAPLMIRSKLIGILTIYNKKDRQGFTEQDQRLLSIIGSQSAQVVENARLQEEEQALIKMRQELELAAKIQKQLLPEVQPSIEGYGLCGRNVTAYSVGGDYYDFIQLDDRRWAICLGDVSGKGLPASLLMSNLQAILRGQVTYKPSPGTLMKNANQQLYQSTGMERFVTLFLGILDTGTHTLQYSIGGHEYPFLIHSDKNYTRLKTGGIPVGVMENQDFAEETIELKPGDKLVIFSDGITDSRNKDDEAFGEERLEQLLAREYQNSGEQIMEIIFNASMEHNGKAQLFDDMTMVVLSRNS